MAKRHLRLREAGWRHGLFDQRARRDHDRGRHRGDRDHEVRARRLGGHGVRTGDGLDPRPDEPSVRARARGARRGSRCVRARRQAPPGGRRSSWTISTARRCTPSSTRRRSARAPRTRSTSSDEPARVRAPARRAGPSSGSHVPLRVVPSRRGPATTIAALRGNAERRRGRHRDRSRAGPDGSSRAAAPRTDGRPAGPRARVASPRARDARPRPPRAAPHDRRTRRRPHAPPRQPPRRRARRPRRPGRAAGGALCALPRRRGGRRGACGRRPRGPGRADRALDGAPDPDRPGPGGVLGPRRREVGRTVRRRPHGAAHRGHRRAPAARLRPGDPAPPARPDQPRASPGTLGRYEHVDVAVVPYFFGRERAPAGRRRRRRTRRLRARDRAG